MKHDYSLWRWACFGVLLLILTALPALSQTVRYVRTDGANTNPASATSWATATADLQGAINASSSGQQVWVKAGTYTPGTTRTSAFDLRPGVAVYGSFLGFETTLNSRSLPINSPPTSILSGEIGNLSIPDDNCYHVVLARLNMPTTTRLDGFQITSGNANGNASYQGDGGGMIIAAGANITTAPTIANCTFTNNRAKFSGGGLFSVGDGTNALANPTITSCTFTSNTALSGDFGGGAICSFPNNGGNHSMTISNSRFTSNYAIKGGAIYTAFGSLFTISNSQFTTNRAGNSGGAVFHQDPPGAADALVHTNNQFTENTASFGGAVYLLNGLNNTFNRCLFRQNRAGVDAGAVYVENAVTNYTNCGFVRNTAATNAGAIYNFLDTPASNVRLQTVRNCSFAGNRSEGTASNTGIGAILNRNASQLLLINSIFFNNGGNKTLRMEVPTFGFIRAERTLFDNSVTGYETPSGTTNFTTPTSPFSDETTLAIQPCSPALDGSRNVSNAPGSLGTIDLLGQPRFIGSNFDLGAVEYQSTTIPAVSPGSIVSAAGSNTVICPNTFFPGINSTNNGFSVRPLAWEYQVNNGSWVVLGATTSSFGSFSIAAVTTFNSVSFRRVAYDCTGNPQYTNVVTYVSSNTVINVGAIAGPPIVPFPQEAPNTLTSQTNASATVTPITLRWQQSDTNGDSWTDIANSNAQSIPLPTISPDGAATKKFQFRRVVANACSLTAATTSFTVTVVATPNDARITGKVVSGDGITGVANVTITAVRNTTGLAGSPGSFTYTTTTASDGTYNLAPLYYGLNTSIAPPGSVTASTFTITPRYATTSGAHVFSPASRTTTALNQFTSPIANINFTDLTTYALTGSVLQSCPDCITNESGSTPLTGYKTCPFNGVTINTNVGSLQTNSTQTGYLDAPAPGGYGRFAVAVSNPGTYSLSAVYGNYTFTPPSRTVVVSDNVYNLTFVSPVSQTIVGRVAAGCEQAIGSAVLEFTDVLKDKDGNTLPSCFKKRVATNTQGYYQVVLPPRLFTVRMLTFTPTAGPNQVNSQGVLDFINNQLPADSLRRDLSLTTAVVTLNLTYERPPTLVVADLPSPAGCSSVKLLAQNEPTPVTVRIYQGDAVLGCPVTGGFYTTTAASGTGTSGTATSGTGTSGTLTTTTISSGTLIIATNVQKDNGETLRPAFINGVANLTLTPGEPNIIAPYYRSFTVQFTDKFGRAATPLSPNLFVSGTKSGSATFSSVSPSIPFMVLHDPPGDGSFSFRDASVKEEWNGNFLVKTNLSQNYWGKVTLGTKFEAGVGILVGTEISSVLGSGITFTGKIDNKNEWNVSTNTSEKISTSPVGIGDGADVFIGGAVNMFYSVATEIAFSTSSCVGSSKKVLIVAPDRIATSFYYTADFIRNNLIPTLDSLRQLSNVSQVQRDDYRDQMNLWQQILNNNEANKAAAEFEVNKSFNGGVGEITESITGGTTKKNSLDFAFEIAYEVATEANVKIAGNGINGGVKTTFKLEIGGGFSNVRTDQITTGYTLRDKDANDFFSVDIKKDPVYKTPVFKLLGGDTSCPPEPNSRPRDSFQFNAPVTVISNVPANGEAVFTLKLGNISDVFTDASRSVTLELLEESNGNGAEVIVNGSPYIVPITYTLGRQATETEVIVKIRRGNPNVYAYEGLKFQLSTGCSGGPKKIVTLSAFFQSPCSSASIVTPETGWISTITDNNQLPVLIGGYTAANLTDVTLEYASAGTSNWYTSFNRTAAQLNSNPNQTLINWNTTGLVDGEYALRLKLTCALGNGGTGVMYSQRVEGVFDRTAPNPFGNAQPASNTYVTGSSIGINYDEPIRCSQISSGNVTVKRQSNGQTIPVSVGCYLNQIVIVPTTSLTSYAGDIISVTLTGIADIYGNTRLTPDTWDFEVGSTTVATGPGTLSVALTNSPLSESATGTMNVVFRLPNAAPNNIFVNFAVSGSAVYGLDYTTSFSPGQPLSATVNGAGGTIMIPTGATSATLLIDPINDPFFEPDETIIITLLDGGGYQIGAAASVTAVILNDDPVGGGNVITSIRTGNWEDAATWDLNRIPIAADQVIIDQSHTVTLTATGNARKITKRSNAKLRLGAITTRLRLGF